MSKRAKVEYHDMYCINCGKAIPLPRKIGHQYNSGHQKVLYCPFCKQTVNHLECKTYTDVIEFKEAFERGDYKDEAEKSIDYIRTNGCRQELLVSTLC